jgi:K+-sensing histidine kinase KdpD
MSSGSPRPWWLLPSGRLNPVWWIPIAAVLLWLDYISSAYIQLPLLYALPVILAAWYSGPWTGLSLAIVVPVAHVAFLAIRPEDTAVLATVMTPIRGVVVAFVALWFARLAEHERDLQREIRALKGLLPICSFCKNIRNEAGEWELLERFITRRSEAQFTHGLCPSCQETHYADVLEHR